MHLVTFDLLVLLKIYIIPFVMVVTILKSDNPKQNHAHLTFGVFGKKCNGKIGFQNLGFIIGLITNGPAVIKLSPFRLQIST